MSFTLSLRETWLEGSDALNRTMTYIVDTIDKVSVQIPTIGEHEIDLQFDVASLVAYYIVSDHDATLYTNNANPSSIGEVIELDGGVPLFWHYEANQSMHFLHNVNDMYIIHGNPTSGVPLQLEIRIARNSGE